MRGDGRLILFIRLSKEQKEALISRLPNIKYFVEQCLIHTADKFIEEDKIRGPSLPEKEK